jgi:hypothetical protein
MSGMMVAHQNTRGVRTSDLWTSLALLEEHFHDPADEGCPRKRSDNIMISTHKLKILLPAVLALLLVSSCAGESCTDINAAGKHFDLTSLIGKHVLY